VATPQIQRPLAERLRRESDRICSLILYSDLEWIDIAIQVDQLREVSLGEAPEKGALFEGIYTARFERLWRQWRD
jgi:hypothetical protein